MEQSAEIFIMVLSLSILAQYVTHLGKEEHTSLTHFSLFHPPPPPSRIGCLAQTIFWSVNQKWLWIYKNKCNNRPEKSLTVSSKFKQLLRTCMNWYGCFILKGILIFCITIHHSKETLCVIHKLIWEQNCQGQESSTSPYLYSRPRREHHCNLLIRCWMEKET